MESATILTKLTGIPLGPVDVSDLNNFSTRMTSPWDSSRSLKLAGLSSGRDSISSSGQKGKSLQRMDLTDRDPAARVAG